jgi:hypothetical protein
MKKIVLISFALIVSHLSVFAQQAIGVLESNTIRCNVSATGDLFNRFDDENLPGYESPAGSMLQTIYASNLWIVGSSVEQSWGLAAEMYQEGNDWFPGPLSNDGVASTTELSQAAWNNVWSANANDVQNHQIYFNAVSNGLPDPFPNGYSIPDWFFTWPAHGNLAENQDYYIAPFFDYNENGMYDPNNGDFPSFCGDQCLFFVFNDVGGIHSESGGAALGLEVQGMLYSFDTDEDENLNHTVFLKYKVINRSSYTYTDVHIGLWNDFDIGNGQDDYIGTNVRRSSIYAYNGDAFDEAVSSSLGYGENLPIQSVVLLAGPSMDDDLMDNPLPDNLHSVVTNSYGPAAYGFGDGIVDNERLGFSSSAYFANSSHPVIGSPDLPSEYANYLRNRWKDGSTVYSGGNGLNSTGVTDVPAAYMFPGSSDPLNSGTNGVEVQVWDEFSAGNIPGDRRILGVTGPFTFMPGDHHVLDFAFVLSQTQEAGNDDSLAFHEAREIAVKQYFDQNLVECQNGQMLLSTTEQPLNAGVRIFPNPANEFMRLSTFGLNGPKQVKMYNSLGGLVYSEMMNGNNTGLNISHLPGGCYVLSIEDSINRVVTPVIID